ncbi:fluoride efflux transporter FluC [Peribacillus acanthi]|uniref:fluoride efflux transporter FluC n=1 Tax=Peribacillus acanthi TaxID=2171554 RepID=UPI00130050FD|nr:CrcB family protein [Peribacillus acanthi]
MFEWTLLLGAFFGGSARYALGILFSRIFNHHLFPFPIFLINLIGSFLFGVANFFVIQNTSLYLLVVTGFLGAFTTYSTFSIESVQLWQEKKNKIFFIYVTSTLVGTIILCTLGFYFALLLL